MSLRWKRKKQLVYDTYRLSSSSSLTSLNYKTTSAYSDLLQRAVSDDNVGTLNGLICSGADINAADQFGDTPLSLAIKRGQYEMASYLIANGSRVEHLPADSVVSSLVESGKISLIKSLLEAGYDVDSKDGLGNTLLHYALEKGNFPELITTILDLSKPNVNAKNLKGRTPFSLALFYPDSSPHNTIERMLRMNAKPFDPIQIQLGSSSRRVSSLYAACSVGKGRGVQKLLEYGLHPDGYFSGKKSRNSSFDLNQNFCQEFRPVCIAIYNSDLSSLKLLLKYNAETQFGIGHAFCVSSSKICHSDALTLSIRLRRYDEAKLLLQTGSRLNWEELDRRQILLHYP
ncbi:DgyrCDS10429 [Dimorphilus gyrociliatus]|uniref:DgyrCDS10429 n=1 Tax=Dimorphilus gyrociliatus TaxID=2664684 RepID=A0A7I8W2R6_9ANNE|nr:DgyrCDS10429 [Dimorphilus gyrociliatus]